MNIYNIPTTDIEPNSGQIDGLPSNPRQWTSDEMDLLKKSIIDTPELFEARGLLVYPHRGKYITLGGNMRYQASLELGMKEVPCIVLPEGLSADKLKEIAIKDNGAFGEWDTELLARDWGNLPLPEWGVDVQWAEESNGAGDADSDVREVTGDDFSEEDKVDNRTQIGDIWMLGSHRLMCGDSADAKCVAKLMGDDKADMVFTDPPYGVAIGDKNKMLNNAQPSGRCCENIINDNVPINELYPILVKAMENCRKNCKDSACYYVTSPQGGDLGLMMMMMKEAGLPVRHILIWKKSSATFSMGRLDYDYQHEPIFYTWTKSHNNYRNGDNRTTVWEYDKPRKCDLHPTMKPVALVANCIKDASCRGDIILDMFGGSGTTLIAAEQLERKAHLMELDPHYCDVIVARWEKLTGKKAEKRSDEI